MPSGNAENACQPDTLTILHFGLNVKYIFALWSFPRGRFFLPNLQRIEIPKPTIPLRTCSRQWRVDGFAWLTPCVEMAIECDKFELGIGHVVDVDVGQMEHVPDFAECFGASEEVEFFRNTERRLLPRTDRRVARSSTLRFSRVCVSEDQEHTQVFKEGGLGGIRCHLSYLQCSFVTR